jgi:hypothetical protein
MIKIVSILSSLVLASCANAPSPTTHQISDVNSLPSSISTSLNEQNTSQVWATEGSIQEADSVRLGNRDWKNSLGKKDSDGTFSDHSTMQKNGDIVSNWSVLNLGYLKQNYKSILLKISIDCNNVTLKNTSPYYFYSEPFAKGNLVQTKELTRQEREEWKILSGGKNSADYMNACLKFNPSNHAKNNTVTQAGSAVGAAELNHVPRKWVLLPVQSHSKFYVDLATIKSENTNSTYWFRQEYPTLFPGPSGKSFISMQSKVFVDCKKMQSEVVKGILYSQANLMGQIVDSFDIESQTRTLKVNAQKTPVSYLNQMACLRNPNLTNKGWQ